MSELKPLPCSAKPIRGESKPDSQTKPNCWHKAGCYWCGDLAGKDYVRFCHTCFLEWEFLRDLGEKVMRNAIEGKDTTAKDVVEMKERDDDFNQRWDKTTAYMRQIGVLK